MTIAIDMPPKQVGMGQLSVGGHDDQLQALLGSCIGIGFIWKKGDRCGLPIACCRKHRGRTPAWAPFWERAM